MFLSFLGSWARAEEQPVSASGTEMDIRADYMEYDEAEKYVVARGSVVVLWEDKELKAENVKFWSEKEFITAETSVSFRQADNQMYCDAFTYDMRTSTGSMVHSSGVMQPWYFRAEKTSGMGEKVFYAEKMRMTTCDYEKPHYHIRARRAKIIMKERITVYNPVFYLRNVPIFYLPIYSSSLKGSKLSIEVQPGYNSEDGLILKTIIGYPLTANSYGKLYLDWFQKRGWGKGAEYNYFIPDKIKTSIYGYHIKQNATATLAESERWQLQGGYWQRINSLWTGQLDMNFQSDSVFNSQYVLDNWTRNNQQMNSSLAFTRQSSRSSFRISAQRVDVSTGSGFEIQTLTLPRLDYTLFPLKWKGFPFYFGLSGSLLNQYSRGTGFYTKSGTLDSSIYRDYRIGRRTTATPQLGVSESWADHDSLGLLRHVFTTRYYNNLNIRYRLANWVDWDYGYNYLLRTRINDFSPDTEADDYGEETKRLFLTNSMYLTRKMTLRNSTGYDFRITRTGVINDWREKLLPLVNELTWLPRYTATVYLREEQILYPAEMRSFQALAQFGDTAKSYVNLGTFYQSAYPDQLDFSIGFGFWPSSKWKIDINNKTTSYEYFGSFRTTYNEVKVYRDLHCWEASTTYRRIADVTEIYFQISLKASSAARNKLYNKQGEQEIHPWRQ